jgi:hypothetical protein
MLCWTAGVLLYSYYNSVATTTDSLLDYYYSLHIRRACRAIACARSESTCLSRSTGSQVVLVLLLVRSTYIRSRSCCACASPSLHDTTVCSTVSVTYLAPEALLATWLPRSDESPCQSATDPEHLYPRPSGTLFAPRDTAIGQCALGVWSFCVRQATVPGLRLLSPVKTGIADPEIFENMGKNSFTYWLFGSYICNVIDN